MNVIDRLERRFGRYAIKNLMLYIVVLFIIGYVIQLMNPLFYFEYLMLDPAMILKGQVWRLVTFLVFPPSTNVLWFVLLCYIYSSIGQSLERYWGAFRFNLYIFVGIFAQILGAFICYFIWGDSLVWYSLNASNSLWLSMFLAIAAMFPDAQFLIYFIVPVKAKWLGILYGVIELYTFITSTWPGRVMIVMSLLNFILFFFLTHNVKDMARQAQRRRQFQQSVNAGEKIFRGTAAGRGTSGGGAFGGAANGGSDNRRTIQFGTGGARHRCAICGRTEKDDPSLEFRYCSRCEGSYEYCMEHLYTHVHVTKDPSANN